MVNPPAFQSSWQMFFLFSLLECGSDWCIWRPDCATYCPALRWRHANRRLCVLFFNQNLSYCRYTGRFDCPSSECGSETTYTTVLWKGVGLKIKKYYIRILKFFLFVNITSLRTDNFNPEIFQHHYPVPVVILREICKIPLYSCNRLMIRKKRLPARKSLSFGNRKKSEGPRSGEYGGCSNNS